MKDLKHIKRFNESEENLNISDVSCSLNFFEQELIRIENNLSNFQKTHYHKNIEQKRQLLNGLNRDKEIILNSIQYLKKLYMTTNGWVYVKYLTTKLKLLI